MVQAASTKPRSRIIRRERAIIERPRLIKMLDACEARTILLLAPAGYGKTTLARQWGKTLSQVAWVSLTSAHRDVTVLARDLAESIEALGDVGFVDFMDRYLRARQNPQSEASAIGRVLADGLERAKTQWIVIDDYHELAGTEAEQLVEVIHARDLGRLLIATRIRPVWADGKRAVYGEIVEIDRDDLAMDANESKLVVGRRTARAKTLVESADGWPAVLALAASIDVSELPSDAMPDSLHRFLAEELFASLSVETQEHLTRLALLAPSLSNPLKAENEEPGLELLFGPNGLLHPLLREFLLSQLAGAPRGRQRLEEAVRLSLSHGEWQHAFDLIVGHRLEALIETAVEQSYRPLTRTGRTWTLSRFVDSVRAVFDARPPVFDVVDAELAYCRGAYGLASSLARRAKRRLPEGHSLTTCTCLLAGTCSFLNDRFRTTQRLFQEALATAVDDRDSAEARFWIMNQAVVTEADCEEYLAPLEERRDFSALDLVRYAMALTHLRRMTSGSHVDELFDECLHALPDVRDPRVSTSLLYTFAYAFGMQARYQKCLDLATQLREQVDAYELDFVRPHLEWISACANLGLRNFTEAERCLQRAEAQALREYVVFHDVNLRALRARTLLQTNRPDEALSLVGESTPRGTFPSMVAEYITTRALALAALGNGDDAIAAAAEAERLSSAAEVLVAAASVRAVAAPSQASVSALFEVASSLDTWDPVICALRTSPSLARQAACCIELTQLLTELYGRTNDRALARNSKLRITMAPTTGDLSPRELEVLGLIVQGLRNDEIANALYISKSTVKVHVRHIFEKIGARTRAEAAARYIRAH